MQKTAHIRVIAAFIAAIPFILSCPANGEGPSIAVFVPGLLEGAPAYEMMDEGVRAAADKAGARVRTIEGGLNEETWGGRIADLASEGAYGLIVTSNPSMSEIAADAALEHPDQDFLVLDGSGLGGEGVTEVVYSRLEQAFLIGYFAGLAASSEELEGITGETAVGMIADREYPRMNREIRPGFEIGLHTANPDIPVEFRVIGSSYDTSKARQLAEELYTQGVGIILTIAGRANQGVAAAAGEAGAYVLWFDSEGTSAAPGTVLAGSVIRQDRAAEEWTRLWLEGRLEMGETTKVGVLEGYIDFPLDTKNMRRHVPQSIRSAMRGTLERMQSGALNLHVLEE